MDTKAEIISLGFSGESRTIFAEDIGRLMFIPAGNTGEAASELPGSHTQSATAPVDPLDGDSWYKTDTEQLFFRINATWCAIPFTADPDGIFIVSMELADVTGTIPGYGVLGRVGLSLSIGDGATAGGIPIGGSGGGGSQLTLITDAAAAVKGYNLTEIPELWQGGFGTYTSVKALSIGNIVTSIGDRAFSGCTAVSGRLVLPDSLITLGVYAFNSCIGLTGELVIPANVDLGVYNSLTNFYGNGQGAFGGCAGLTSYRILCAATCIPAYLFQNCSGLTGSLVIPPTVTAIGGGAFENCAGLTGNLVLPEGLVWIGARYFSSTFGGCTGLTGTLVIPPLVEFICNSAFYGCTGFTGHLEIPSSVTHIGHGAFAACAGITSATIPPTMIPDADPDYRGYLFYQCASLLTVNCHTPRTFLDEMDNLTDSGVTTIHARASDATWTAGAGQTIGGKSGITVIKDL